MALHRWKTVVALLLPPVLVATVFVALLVVDGSPLPRHGLGHEAFSAQRCTWACHNHGCRHASVLPGFLVDDDGLFGAAVHSLYTLGARLLPGQRFAGYGAANLVVFCAVWPAGMYGLWIVAVLQRRRLSAVQAAQVPR